MPNVLTGDDRIGVVHIDALNAAKGPSSADVALSGSAIRNLGVAWNPPIKIGKGHNAEVAFNRPYLEAAYNFDTGTGVTAIRYATSTDGGNTFTPPWTLVSDGHDDESPLIVPQQCGKGFVVAYSDLTSNQVKVFTAAGRRTRPPTRAAIAPAP